MSTFIGGKGVVWEEIQKLKVGRARKKAAIAYFSAGAKLEFGKGDLLIVDASAAAIKDGRTSAAMLDAAIKRGADVFSCPKLHAKFVIFGSDCLVAGSMNASSSSEKKLVEAALVTGDRGAIDKAEIWIDELAQELDEQGFRLTRQAVDGLKKLKVIRRKSEDADEAGGEAVNIPSARMNNNPKTVYAMVTYRQRMRGPDVERANKVMEAGIATLKTNMGWSWISMPKPPAAMRSIKVGDDMFLGARDGRGAEIYVSPFCHVTQVDYSKITDKVIVHYTYRLSDTEIAVDDFVKRMKKCGVKVSPQSAGTLIPSGEAKLIRENWKKAAKPRQRQK